MNIGRRARTKMGERKFSAFTSTLGVPLLSPAQKASSLFPLHTQQSLMLLCPPPTRHSVRSLVFTFVNVERGHVSEVLLNYRRREPRTSAPHFSPSRAPLSSLTTSAAAALPLHHFSHLFYFVFYYFLPVFNFIFFFPPPRAPFSLRLTCLTLFCVCVCAILILTLAPILLSVAMEARTLISLSLHTRLLARESESRSIVRANVYCIHTTRVLVQRNF